jgi:hypothetical protein
MVGFDSMEGGAWGLEGNNELSHTKFIYTKASLHSKHKNYTTIVLLLGELYLSAYSIKKFCKRRIYHRHYAMSGYHNNGTLRVNT